MMLTLEQLQSTDGRQSAPIESADYHYMPIRSVSVIYAACVHSGDDSWPVRAFRTEAMALAWIENLRTIEKAWKQSGEQKRPDALAITADGAEHLFIEEMEFEEET